MQNKWGELWSRNKGDNEEWGLEVHAFSPKRLHFSLHVSVGLDVQVKGHLEQFCQTPKANIICCLCTLDLLKSTPNLDNLH